MARAYSTCFSTSFSSPTSGRLAPPLLARTSNSAHFATTSQISAMPSGARNSPATEAPPPGRPLPQDPPHHNARPALDSLAHPVREVALQANPREPTCRLPNGLSISITTRPSTERKRIASLNCCPTWTLHASATQNSTIYPLPCSGQSGNAGSVHADQHELAADIPHLKVL